MNDAANRAKDGRGRGNWNKQKGNDWDSSEMTHFVSSTGPRNTIPVLTGRPGPGSIAGSETTRRYALAFDQDRRRTRTRYESLKSYPRGGARAVSRPADEVEMRRAMGEGANSSATRLTMTAPLESKGKDREIFELWQQSQFWQQQSRELKEALGDSAEAEG